MQKVFTAIILTSMLLFSCTKVEENMIVEGLKPVYISAEQAKQISSETAGIITKGSKIYIKDNMVYIVEQSLGVHIIDNSNPANPVGVRFLSVPGITDVAVRNNIMYANNVQDLIAIDISNYINIEITKRLENVYAPDSDKFPAFYSGYFECVDERNGVVIDWEQATLENPKCRRI